ncbi:hypothetical protein [Rhodanobacter sp. BL-MT-08]
MPSILDKLRQRIRSSASETVGDAAEPEQSLAEVCHRIEPQGLFIIGAARTGTTIMQNALNDSRDIFLFGEPGFHHDGGANDFATRYNAMHRSWGNQENKSSYCPPLFEQDTSWHAYLARLAQTYRYVGSKIVINPPQAECQTRELFDFHCRHFYASHYLFTFRNPLDVLISTRGLAELNGGTVATFAEVLKGYFLVVQLFFRALRNLPHVDGIFHEAVESATFRKLETLLGTPLPNAADYYSKSKVRRYELTAVPESHRGLVAEAIGLYDRMKRETLAGLELIQIEQNAGHFDPSHFTALGQLSRDVSTFLRTIDAQA